MRFRFWDRTKKPVEEPKPEVKEEPPEPLQPGDTWTSPTGIEFVVIPAGTFLMDAAKRYNATPHEVTISRPFALGIYPVKQAEWSERDPCIMPVNPSEFQREIKPVEGVTWDDCQRFIMKLNALEMKWERKQRRAGAAPRKRMGPYRLPTESEWEYACRAGSSSLFCFGDSEAILPDFAWYVDNSYGETQKVGQLEPNDWGLYDMHGNVWEWCSDWYDDYPRTAVTDPVGADESPMKVVRGGSWALCARCCAAPVRGGCPPGVGNHGVGFRLARTILE